MQLRFKQAVSIDGQKFPLGVHEVDEKLLENSYMVKLMKCGYVTKTDEKNSLTPQQLHAKELEDTKVLTARLDAARLKKEKLAEKNLDADIKNEEQAKVEGEIKETKKNNKKR